MSETEYIHAKKKKRYHTFTEFDSRVHWSCITNCPGPSKSKKPDCWSQIACRKMDCNSFAVAQSTDCQRCVAALIQTWLVSIPPAASMKRSLQSCQHCTPTGHFQLVFLGSHSADRLVASGHRLLSGCRDDVADRETSHSKLSWATQCM